MQRAEKRTTPEGGSSAGVDRALHHARQQRIFLQIDSFDSAASDRLHFYLSFFNLNPFNLSFIFLLYFY